MAVTHSQTKRSQANEANLREVSLMHKDTPPPVLTHGKEDDAGELGQLKSKLEKTASAVEATEPSVTSPGVPHTNNWYEEYNFDDLMVVGGKNKKRVSRSEKREARYNHAKTQSILRSGFNLEAKITEASGRGSYDTRIQKEKS